MKFYNILALHHSRRHHSMKLFSEENFEQMQDQNDIQLKIF
jgi:hypothetical protein